MATKPDTAKPPATENTESTDKPIFATKPTKSTKGMRMENHLSETVFAALYLSVLSVFSVAGFRLEGFFVDFVGFVAKMGLSMYSVAKAGARRG